MKTQKYIFTLLVAIAAVIAYASTASAGSIVGSKHDLSALTGETCGVCHAPHSDPALAIDDAPLANHKVTGSTFTLYASGTLDATVQQPGGTDVLCLSCHDGTVAIDSYGGLNPTSTNMIPAAALIGTDLGNDHPTSFDYGDVTGQTAEFQPTPGALPLFSNTAPASTTFVRCATCHNVHDPATAPFLRTTKSALCTSCHIK